MRTDFPKVHQESPLRKTKTYDYSTLEQSIGNRNPFLEIEYSDTKNDSDGQVRISSADLFPNSQRRLADDGDIHQASNNHLEQE